MRTIVKYTRFFIFTQDATKSYLAEFTDGINIIYGANTSGKSSVIQSINYTFGINDEKYKLADLLAENLFLELIFLFSVAKKYKYVLLLEMMISFT